MGHKIVPRILFLAAVLAVLRLVPQSDARDIRSFLENTSEVGSHENSTSVTKWALLVAGSNGYYNYRHQSDVCHAYQILKDGGLKDENIIVFMYDDIAYSPYNPLQGFIRNRLNGSNVYPGVPKDYTGEQVTAENFYNVILANRSGLTGGSGKVLDSGPNDHIFIYYSDHGAEGLLGMPNGSPVFAIDFLEVLKTKYQAKSYSEMVIYVEACNSGSMFEGGLLDNLNIYATTAANPHESSYACYMDEEVQALLGDSYSVSWMEDSEEHDPRTETLEEQYERVRKRVGDPREFEFTSQVMQYGTKKLGTKTLSNFFWNGDERIIVPDDKITDTQISHPRTMSTVVPQRDVKLYLLHQKYLRAPIGSAVMHLAKKELDDEIAFIERVDLRMAKMIVASFGSDKNASTIMLEAQRPAGKPIVDDWVCLKNMLEIYGTHCGKMSDYELRYTHSMVIMCNAGIRAERFASVAEVVCGRSK